MFINKKRTKRFDTEEYHSLIRDIGHQRAYVVKLIDRVKFRKQLLRSKLDRFKSSREAVRVEIYRQELDHISRLHNVLRDVDMGLISVSERLDTLKILLKAVSGFKPMAESIEEALKVSSIIPADFEDVLGQLAHSYSDLLSIIHPPNASIRFDLQTSEAEDIIVQVENELEREILVKYPDTPISEAKRSETLPARIEELVLATDGGTILHPKRYNSKMTFEDKVLHYVNSCKGKIDVFSCARYLKSSPNRIVEALYELAEEGRLKFRR